MLFSWEKRAILLFLITLSISDNFLIAQNNTIRKYDLNKTEVLTISSDEWGLKIHYSISSATLSGSSVAEGDFYRINIPGHITTSETGKPEFPVLSRLIEIPDDERYTVSIKNVKVKRINPGKDRVRGLLQPRQHDETKTQVRQKNEFVIDRNYYSGREFAGPDTVSVNNIGKIRDVRLAALTISPVRYNPFSNILEVITSMEIEIKFESNLSKSKSFSTSVAFEEILSKGILNYSQSDVIPAYTDKPAGMIILSDTSFRRVLQPFISWKKQKGFRVTELYRGTQPAGSTYEEIKSAITSIYTSGLQEGYPPLYLLIVGNPSKIPLSGGTTQVSDMYYGEFDGAGDYLPDMFIGRLPVADTSELRGVLKKIISYEKFEFADTNRFYSRTLISAGNESSYADYMNGQLKYADTYYLNPVNKISNHIFYYPKSFSSEDTIIKTINRGVSFINYTGHGDESGWLDPVFKVAQVTALVNENMYPFVITNACRTGNYSVTNSFGNRLVNSSKKGAVGFIGCSNDSYWSEDFYWAVGTGTPGPDPKYTETGLGALDRLFHKNNELASDWYITMGQVNYAGNLAVSGSTSTRKKYYWETYTLLGDPSVIPYIGSPDTLNVELPDTLPNGMESLSLTLPPFTYIAISQRDTLWDATHASPSGSAILEMPGVSDDSCLVVITGQNYVPVIKTVYFADRNDEYVTLSANSINDSEANGNGRADFGESFFLSLKVSNLGLTAATNLTASISSTSSDIAILSDSYTIGTLAAKSSVTITDKLAIKVNDEISDMTIITLDLILKDSKGEKNYRIDIPLHAPILNITNCLIDDSGGGNGDFVADPGETFNLLFNLANSGSSDISGILKITNLPEGVIMNQTSVNTGIIRAGETRQIPVSVTLLSSATKGSSFEVISMLDCSPYIEYRSFLIPVGKIRESFEYQSFSMFPWEIPGLNPWLITGGTAFDGEFSARSAVITNSSESVLRMKVNSPVTDTVKFMVRVSCESNYDYLYIKKNGKVVASLTGETGWLEKKIPVSEGISVLEWVYKKDQSVSAGSDCAWLDFVTFPVLALNKVDLKSDSILTPDPDETITIEIIAVQVVNLGSDTLKTFNMAYQVNDRAPVAEQFTKIIYPGDTASVEFTVKADMIKNGTYIIKAYGINNNDGYLNNDTAKLVFTNTAIVPVDNPENRVKTIPNPFSDSFRIEFYSAVYENIKISITDLAGRKLFEYGGYAVSGENSLELNPASLPPGLYNLIIKGKTLHKAARIIKRE